MTQPRAASLRDRELCCNRQMERDTVLLQSMDEGWLYDVIIKLQCGLCEGRRRFRVQCGEKDRVAGWEELAKRQWALWEGREASRKVEIPVEEGTEDQHKQTRGMVHVSNITSLMAGDTAKVYKAILWRERNKTKVYNEVNRKI